MGGRGTGGLPLGRSLHRTSDCRGLNQGAATLDEKGYERLFDLETHTLYGRQFRFGKVEDESARKQEVNKRE